MRDIGVNLMLTGGVSQDATPYRLEPLYPICHVPKNAINQRVQGLINIYRPGSLRLITSNQPWLGERYRLTSSNAHTTTPPSLYYTNNASQETTLTKCRQQSLSIPRKNNGVVVPNLRQTTNDEYIDKSKEHTIDCIERALAKNYPVIIAINICDDGSWDNPSVINSFRINTPNFNQTPLIRQRGSHAVLITAYDQNAKWFRIKNSWGNNWGRYGDAFIDYDYVALCATELIPIKNKLN